MERYAELTKERQLNIKCRVNETSVPRILRFLNSDRSPHAITSYDFEIPVKKIPDAVNDIFKLTIGDGLTVHGVDSNDLLIEVSEERATQRPNVYFWRLFSVFEDHTWLNGDWQFFIGKYDGVDNVTEISLGDESIIEIVLTGSDLSLLNTRVRETESISTLTPNVSLYDMDVITEQGEALVIANPTGTPSDGNGYVIRITDDGTGRAITKYRAFGSALPTTTTANKTLYIAFIRNEADDMYDVLPSQEQI